MEKKILFWAFWLLCSSLFAMPAAFSAGLSPISLVSIDTSGPDGPDPVIIELISGAGSPHPNPKIAYIQKNCGVYSLAGDAHYFKIVKKVSGPGSAGGFAEFFFNNRTFFEVVDLHQGATSGLVIRPKCPKPWNGGIILESPSCQTPYDYIYLLNEFDQPIYKVSFTLLDQFLRTYMVCAEKLPDADPNLEFLFEELGVTPGDPLEPGDHASESGVFNNSLSTAPNPFSDLLQLSMPETSKEQDVQISLYDLQGRQILNQQFPGGSISYTLSTQDIIPGMYILHVRAGNLSKTTKVMKAQ